MRDRVTPGHGLPLLPIALGVVVLALIAGSSLAARQSEHEAQAAASPSARVAVASGAATPTATTLLPAIVKFEPVGANTPRLQEVAAADATAQRLYAVAEAAQLLRSDDGGRTWTRLTPPTSGNGTHVAAAGDLVVVTDGGHVTAAMGVTVSGGILVSRDGGATWKRARGVDAASNDAVHGLVAGVFIGRVGGTPMFLAASMPPSSGGAATGGSTILASADGEAWRAIGKIPGAAFFAMLDVPIVAFSGSIPGEGVYRVEGADLASLHLTALPASPQPADGALTTGPGAQEIWSFFPSTPPRVRHSLDGGRTWQLAATGLSGRTAGLFILHGTVFAIGDGAYSWDGAQWRVATVLTGKALGVFQLGGTVLLQDVTRGLWRSP